jgi:hypothetical protein
MAPSDAKAEFTNRLRARGLELSRVSVDAGFSEALAFYRDVRAAGCEKDIGGDMLLFQWGTYDWGKGRYFNLDLTRQFVLEGTEDDEGIFQLAFTFLYTPSPALESLQDGNRWCRSPADLAEFQRYVTSSEAYRVALGQIPAKVQLTYGTAG